MAAAVMVAMFHMMMVAHLVEHEQCITLHAALALIVIHVAHKIMVAVIAIIAIKKLQQCITLLERLSGESGNFAGVRVD